MRPISLATRNQTQLFSPFFPLLFLFPLALCSPKGELFVPGSTSKTLYNVKHACTRRQKARRELEAVNTPAWICIGGESSLDRRLVVSSAPFCADFHRFRFQKEKKRPWSLLADVSTAFFFDSRETACPGGVSDPIRACRIVRDVCVLLSAVSYFILFYFRFSRCFLGLCEGKYSNLVEYSFSSLVWDLLLNCWVWNGFDGLKKRFMVCLAFSFWMSR